MPKLIRCHCNGNPACQLCHGDKFYEYQPGPRGWIPFRCPTCQGTRLIKNAEGVDQECFTCARAGYIDPANPPVAPGWLGAMRVGWKTFFGGG